MSDSLLSVSGTEFAALQQAVALAMRGAGSVLPNPVVGCVLLSPAGDVVGTGFHERAGGPHAEVAALSVAGSQSVGATAVVTLEPCNHTGRTGPCSQALIAAGVARVLVAVRDPSPAAAGGIDRLRHAGIEVVDLSAALTARAAPADLSPADTAPADVGDVVAAARDANRVWLGAMEQVRPFVTLKMATTIDGRVAAVDGSSRWISSVESRAHAHTLRQQVDTMMVGVGTVLADNPLLTARDAAGQLSGRQPLRVVVDTQGNTPADAAVRNEDAPTLIATAAGFGTDSEGRVDLKALLTALFERGHRHVLLEGGPRLAAAALDAGVVNEVMLYLAPMLLGAGLSALSGGHIATISAAHRAVLRDLNRCGPDILARFAIITP